MYARTRPLLLFYVLGSRNTVPDFLCTNVWYQTSSKQVYWTHVSPDQLKSGFAQSESNFPG